MYGPCDESLLNKLLNEMDGLREDAAVLFVLTTNRPEHLETGLASRPGRIDQAIEFPLPDEQGRRQLARLYSCGLTLTDDVVELVVKKTKNASAAFIKELMRRSAQYGLQNGGSNALGLQALDAALEDAVHGWLLKCKTPRSCGRREIGQPSFRFVEPQHPARKALRPPQDGFEKWRATSEAY